MASYHVSIEARKSCWMVATVVAVLVSPACIIEIVVSQNGWMRPCSQPSEFHGLSSLVSIGEVSAGWSDRNLAPKHSVTSEWSAHS